MPSVLDDKTKKPNEAALAEVLSKAKRYWDEILEYLDRQCSGLAQEWKFYGQKYGWQLKLADKKRALIYLIPHQGHFTAALALKDEAVQALKNSGLPPQLVHEIETAKVVPEGRPARIEVNGRPEAEIVKRLLDIKLKSSGRG